MSGWVVWALLFGFWAGFQSGRYVGCRDNHGGYRGPTGNLGLPPRIGSDVRPQAPPPHPLGMIVTPPAKPKR